MNPVILMSVFWIIKANKMKTIMQILLILFSVQFLFSQTIEIGTGASMDVGSGADICGATITGTVTGDGTQCGSPLPVELTSFLAVINKGIVNLSWETATEVNNYGFEIERTTPHPPPYQGGGGEAGAGWAKIGFVEGNGNSNSTKSYSFTDNNLTGGNKFSYRLKQIDNDGMFEYSDEIEVEVLPNSYALEQNYPNPFNPSTTIKFSLPEYSRVMINIYNMLGEKIIELVNADYQAGFHQLQFNSSSAGYNLASGIYVYTLEAKNFKDVKKMMLMK